MSFIYHRKIRFQDTDAAGVVYFANVLGICHEAYEESLATSGINLKSFFSNIDIAIPIINANIDFFRPMFCGDKIIIHLSPKYITSEKFEIGYQLFTDFNELIAKAITKHVCINPLTRNKIVIPEYINQWLTQYTETESID